MSVLACPLWIQRLGSAERSASICYVSPATDVRAADHTKVLAHALFINLPEVGGHVAVLVMANKTCSRFANMWSNWPKFCRWSKRDSAVAIVSSLCGVFPLPYRCNMKAAMCECRIPRGSGQHVSGTSLACAFFKVVSHSDPVSTHCCKRSCLFTRVFC